MKGLPSIYFQDLSDQSQDLCNLCRIPQTVITVVSSSSAGKWDVFYKQEHEEEIKNLKINLLNYLIQLQSSMATYFNGNSEIQGDGLQTLILMNPRFVGYSDTTHHQSPPQSNFVFLNSTPVTNNIPHAPPPSGQTQPFVGIPLSTQNSHPPSLHSQHDISSIHGLMPRSGQYGIYNHPVQLTEAREVTRSQQGLSLSLSSQQPPGYGSQPTAKNISPTTGGGGGVETRQPGGGSSSASGISNGVNGMHSVLLNSKYLKATQDLLDEVANVGKGVLKNSDQLTNSNNGQPKSPASAGGEGQSAGEFPGKRTVELTTTERQEIQMKKAKLFNMLDEVEQRYRQYHNQMQIVISWFEQAAGISSAKTYTALALQTISKQFRCLKDAILGQVKAASKSLGEDDGLGGGRMEGSGGGGSRLKFVDNQIRQQRALQQLGMIQHNAWRPQRGLPERSVSVLRAWLFEHFLHPYPKDSDKHMLAKQTGLTRSQVSNWFINARVRLWKPMVEEMYLEEVKEHERNGSDDKTSKSKANEDSASKSTALGEKNLSPGNQNRSFKSKQEKPKNIMSNNISPLQIPVSPVSTIINFQNQSGFTLVGSSGMEQIANFSPKKQRGNEVLHSPSSMQSMNMDTKHGEGDNDQMTMKFGNERQSRDGFTLMGSPMDFMGGLGSYPIGDIGRFGTDQFQGTYSGNGVSLTLGLPHCENLSMQGGHQSNFLSNQSIQLGRGVGLGQENEFGTINAPNSHSAAMYETMNIQNRKRFAAQLLPDFVS